jgi:hypothetical protein
VKEWGGNFVGKKRLFSTPPKGEEGGRGGEEEGEGGRGGRRVNTDGRGGKKKGGGGAGGGAGGGGGGVLGAAAGGPMPPLSNVQLKKLSKTGRQVGERGREGRREGNICFILFVPSLSY